MLTNIRARVRAAVGGLPRPFWFIWGGVFVTRVGSFVLPFLALYLTQALHLSLAQAGLVISLYGAGGAVAGPIGGYLADHVGRRRVMVTALLLGGAGMILLGTAHRVEIIAPGIFLLALVTEMYRPAMQAAVADLVPPAERVRAFGLVYWVVNVGFAIGLTLGGLVASRSFFWLFVGDGLTTLVFGLVIWLGVPETRPAATAAATAHGSRAAGFLVPFRDLPFVGFIGLTFCFAAIFMQNATTFPLDMTAHGVSKVVFGQVLALNGVLIVLVQPFLGPFLAPLNRSNVLAVGAVLAGIGFGLNAVAHTVPFYVLGVVVWTLGEMCVLPVANAFVADLAPAHMRGRYQGAYSLAFGLAVCAAPAFGTLVLQRLGSVVLWSACFVLGVVIAAGQLALRRPLARARERTANAA